MNLDEKLRVIAIDHGVQGEGQDLLVDEVKAVFAAEPIYQLVQKYQAAGGDMDNAVIISQGDIANNMALNGYMLGQEWFNRFKAELNTDLNKYSILEEEDYIEAARRAAGLTEDSK